MDHAARVAYIYAQTVCALAEIEAMKALNREREAQGYSPGYTEADFRAIPDQYGIGHNSVIDYLRG